MASKQASAFGLKDSSLIKNQAFINGKWLDAKDGATISVNNPATNEEIGTIPEMGLEETKEAIDAASTAFQTWGKTTAKYRHDLLMKLFHQMQENADDLARIILANRAGIPEGVINIVTTQKNVLPVGKEMCENKAVRKVTFTGSTPVAKLLYGLASSTLKKVSIEAGGNAPFIVFDDANLADAVEGAAICKFRGSGQTCVCANRIYVHASVYDEFAAKLAEKVASFKIGNGLEKETTHGPLIHGRAIEKATRHIEDAVSKGAQILVGGKGVPNTTFFQPTLLSDVPSDALVGSEETFGPVAALIKFNTEEEVIKLANSTDVGLAGYFYSRDVGRVWRVAERLEVGMVGCNTGLISQTIIPFGGVKESGLGREGGHGISEYLNDKLIVFGGLGA
ncbi:hypothetical protein ONZ45_g14980 [Pleurotus djamor]|nr:hypothetical protein ONZ45_g14980 [Pleurotus djamor]